MESSYCKESNLLPSLILLVACIICYSNSLQNGLCFDDTKVIIGNMDIRTTTPLQQLFLNDYWGRPLHEATSHKSYRPLTILSFRWNYAIHELDPMGYHLINVLLHWVLSVLLVNVFQIFLSRWETNIFAILFMVHPVHTDAVTGVVGRADILAAIWMILALASYIRGSQHRKTNWKFIYLTTFLTTLAMLCKEQGITIVAICCGYEMFWLRKVNFSKGLHLAETLFRKPRNLPGWFNKSLQRMISLILFGVGLLILRIYLMGTNMPIFTKDDNPAAVAPTPVRQLTQWYLLPINVWLLLYPYPLLCDYTRGTIPLVQSITDPRNLATLTFIITLSVISGRALMGHTKTSRQLCVALSFVVFPFLPASNLFFRVGFVVAERILYVPSIGFSMLIAMGMKRLTHVKRLRKLAYLIFILTIGLHAAKTIRRNIDWKSAKTLYMSGLHIARNNSKLWNNAGHMFFADNDMSTALQYFKQGTIEDPGHISSYIYVGRTYHQAMNNNSMAMKYFRKAELLIPPQIPGKKRHIDKNTVSIYVSMARILKQDKTNYLEAIELYKQAISLRHDFVDAYLDLGSLLITMNNLDEAAEVFEKLLKFEPNNVRGIYNMGVVEFNRKNKQKAIQWFEKCLQLDPAFTQAKTSLEHLKENTTSEDI
ncbi:protein O-mannosyl-transferase TMTC3-like isoform X2 [Apostichopus japonicus]